MTQLDHLQAEGADADDDVDLWDPDQERMMLLRFSVIAAFDLAEHAVKLKKSKRFSDALAQNAEQKSLFDSGYANLVGTLDRWRRLRNKLFAHVDTGNADPVAVTLRKQSTTDAVGEIAVGKLRGDFAFPAATFVLMLAMSTDDDWEAGFIAALKLLDTANAAAMEIVWPAIGAYHVLTGTFLGEGVRLRGWPVRGVR